MEIIPEQVVVRIGTAHWRNAACDAAGIAPRRRIAEAVCAGARCIESRVYIERLNIERRKSLQQRRERRVEARARLTGERR